MVTKNTRSKITIFHGGMAQQTYLNPTQTSSPSRVRIKNGDLLCRCLFLLEKATHPANAQTFTASCSDSKDVQVKLKYRLRKVSPTMHVALGSSVSSLRPSNMFTCRTAKRSSLGISCHDRTNSPGCQPISAVCIGNSKLVLLN